MSKSPGMHPEFSVLIPIRPYGSAAPLFFLHGVDGVVPDVEGLLKKIDPEHPVYGVRSQASDPQGLPLTTLEEMAAYYLREIRRAFPQGPYYLIGFSFGGMLAYEMAQQLMAQGEERTFIGMIDATEMSYLKRQAKLHPPGQRASDIYQRLRRRFGEAFERPDTLSYIREKFESRWYRMLYSLTSKIGMTIPLSLHDPYHVNWFAAVNYMPRLYDGKIFLYKAKDHFWEPGMPPDLGWGELVSHGVEMIEIPGRHNCMFLEPSVSVLGEHMARSFELFAREVPEQAPISTHP